MRESTFANIGNDITANTKMVEGLPEDFCFTVSKKPLGFLDDNGNFNQVKGHSTVVRDDNGKSYGAVSDKYQTVDNLEALGSVQYMDGLTLRKYGETHTGMQYLIGELPETKILGDAFKPFLIYRNSFNGRYPIQVAISPLRIVCQNQLTLAFGHAQNTISIRHTKTAKEKVAQAQEVMMKVGDFLTDLTKEAERLAGIRLTPAQEVEVIRSLFPIKEDMTDRQKATISQQLSAFEIARHTADNANFKGTAWGLVNAYTDFLTHNEGVRETKTGAENRFVAVSFDPRLLGKLLTAIRQVAA